ncbi:MAG: tRNA (adenosine(37)-N6)-threonylcarbamoyltransferase complex ATPase subunit type 1 TsaE [Ignavibacteria bacterium]|nr:tRNA (adenosine(37)-N6)-threonylcarbamoyltransferase complex ATPase subunit type 1 TsaE [Ignavibacteria bacterium]
MRTVTTRSAKDTADLGESFGAMLKPGDVVALFGELGTGKTEFVKGICAGLQISGRPTSPTFTIINEYPARFGIVAHIDLYRIGGEAELRDLGIESYFHEGCICLIEWADRALAILPGDHYAVKILHGDGSERERMVTISSPGELPS